MKYREIDRDLLIRKRRIAFELGESTLPKYAKKFIERVLDSEELTPTLSETAIRADERTEIIAIVKNLKDSVPVNRVLDDIIHDKPKELGMLIAYDTVIKLLEEEPKNDAK